MDQFSHSVVSDSLQPHGLQHARLPCSSPTPRAYSNSCRLIGDTIQPSHPLLSPSPPAPNPCQHKSLSQGVNSLHEVAKVLEFQLQHHSFQGNPRADLLQNGLIGSPCSPRDSQDSSPTPQFKMDSPLNKRSLKRVTEGNASKCSFPWSQSWELHAALLIPVFQELIRNI